MDGDDLRVSADVATAFAEAELGVASHMNEDHADAVRLYATRLLGAPDGAWTVVAADADGLDLAADGDVRRLAFDARQPSVGALRPTLKALSDKARATD